MKEQYEGAVEAARAFCPVEPNGSFEIPPSATKRDCLAYTLYHVCGQKPVGRRHYRYDRYWHALDDSLTRVKAPYAGPHRMQIFVDELLPGKAPPAENAESVDAFGANASLVILDIGSGPGTFSWVAHDYFLSSPEVDVKLFALDRCPGMVRLARALWERMDTCCDLNADHDWRRMRSDLSNALSCARRAPTLIVTMGHLLVQIVNDAKSIEDVADTLADCVSLASALVPRRECLVIGADAHSGTRPESFKRAWNLLQDRLDDTHGISLSSCPLSLNSQMCGVAACDPVDGRQRG